MYLVDVIRSLTSKLLKTVYNTVCCDLPVGDIMLKCLLHSETKPGTFPLKQGREVIKSLTTNLCIFHVSRMSDTLM